MRRKAGAGAWVAGWAAVLLLLPALYQLSVSLMSPDEALAHPPAVFPAVPRVANYAAGARDLGLPGLLATTAVLAALTAALQVLTGAAGAYALARLRFPGRRPAVRMLPLLAAVPALALLVPRFVILDAWGWTGGFPALAAPGLVSAGAMLFLYEVFRTLPRDSEEAARLDGAGEWTIFSKVALPQTRPALAVVAGAAILSQWRGLLWPLVVTGRDGAPVVAELGLARAAVGAGGTPVPEVLAMGLTLAVPALAVALGVAFARARAARASAAGSSERELPVEVSALAAGPFEHHIL